MTRSTDAITSESNPASDAAWRRALRRTALNWFDIHARDLPWRENTDPYRVWVSEIMLQQTQVETVKPYFQRFIARFPDVRRLALADEADVLRLWEGLGYYRRARQMHLAAQRIVQQHEGRFPEDLQHVLALPGIGRYTAGAILSIAGDQRLPILEANTLRLFSRLIGYRADPRRAEGQRRLWEFAQQVLPRTRCGAFNQAMMELGSRVCKPRDPRCDVCPLVRLCVARAHGWQDSIPVASKKTTYEDLAEIAVIVRNRELVLLRRCGPHQRWAGLWDFPRFGSQDRPHRSNEIARQVTQQTGVSVAIGARLTTIKHGVTRFRITLSCYAADYVAGQPDDPDNCRWVTQSELSAYPLSVTGRKLSRWIGDHAP